jgi:DNA-binding MarR family transcriptional regulator
VSHQNLYFQFLSLCKLAHSDNLPHDISPNSQALLGIIALAEAKGHPLTVMQTMALHNLASPATLHRRVDALREGLLIDMVFHAGDRRTKYLIPTALAHRYFDHMGQLMQQVFSPPPTTITKT